jgi:short-subunit dehydrogenase
MVRSLITRPSSRTCLSLSKDCSKAAASSLTSNMRLEFKALGVKVVEIKTGTAKTYFFNNVNKKQERN